MSIRPKNHGMLEYERRLLDVLGEQSSLTPDQNLRRRQFEVRANIFRSPYPPQLDVANWYVAVPGREIPIRIYRPDASGVRPTIIYLHGGGYRSGSLESHDTVVANLAMGTGAQIIAVHYRRAPENPYPAAVEDGYAILEWAAANAGSLEIDTSRLALAGDSAGGALTAAISMMARDRNGPALALQLLIYPGPMNPNTSSDSYIRNGFDPQFNKPTIEFCLKSYVGNLESTDPYAIPLRQTDYTNLPSAIIHAAEFDPILDDAILYADRLQAAGVKVELRVAKNLLHSFLRAVSVSAEAQFEANHMYGTVRQALELPR